MADATPAPAADAAAPAPAPAAAAADSEVAAATEQPAQAQPASQSASARSSPASGRSSPADRDAHGRRRRRRQSYFQVGGLKREAVPVTAVVPEEPAAPEPAAAAAEPAAPAAAEPAAEAEAEPVPEQTDTWDSVTQQPTCVLCSQVFTSAGKLKQHEQFSTLHEANLRKLEKAKERAERGEAEDSGDEKEEDDPEAGGHSKLIYQGSKFFWRTSERVDVHIYEEDAPPPDRADAPIITVIPFNVGSEEEYPYLFVGSLLAEAQLDQEAINTIFDGERKYFTQKERTAIRNANRRNALVTYLLARLDLVDEGSRRLCRLVKLTGDEYDTIEVEPPQGFKTEKIRRRRRSSIADFRRASVELDEERKKLHEATAKAERLAMLTRMGMNAFMDHLKNRRSQSNHSPIAQRWKVSARRTVMRAHVQRTREILASLQGYEDDLAPGAATAAAIAAAAAAE